MLLAVPLDQLLQDHRARGHVDAQRQRLGREHGLDQAPDEELLHDLLEGRQHAGVVRGDAPLQAFEPFVVPEDVQVLGGDGGGPLLDDTAHLQARFLVVEPQARVQALLDGGLATGAAEDEVDGGQQVVVVEAGDHLGTARRPDPAARAPLALAVGLADHLAAPPVLRVVRAAVLLARHAQQIGVDLPAGGAAAAVVGLLLEEVVHPPAGHDVLPQRYGPLLGDDHVGVAADGVQPVAELLRVGHGGREGHQGHRLGEVNDHFLPDGAAEAVGEVVHLVHHDVAEAAQRLGARVQHVAEHLGGHDDHGRVPVDAVVAGQQAHLVGAVALDEVGELLVRQGLDRRRVEALAALRERRCTANSPTMVLPEPVGAATSTPLPASSALQASTWYGSRSNSYISRKGGQGRGLFRGADPGSGVPLGG
ncbi:hypothetical protein GCM10020254_65850 [Streptomyces goshikiensis]